MSLLPLFEKLSTRKNLISLFITSHAVLLAMMIFTFPEINHKISTEAFDLKTFGYSYSEALAILDKLDEQTTNLYIFPQLLLLDILYPFLLTLLLSGLIVKLNSTLKSKLFDYLFLMPFLILVFDYTENGCILFMLLSNTIPSEAFVLVASTCTTLKSVVTILSWIVIIIQFFSFIFKSKHFKNTLSNCRVIFLRYFFLFKKY